MRRVAYWIAGILAVVVVVLIVSDYFGDEPLRRRLEAQLDASVEGYTFHIGKANFHPVPFSISLWNVVVVQDANPDPPVADIQRLKASIHWLALIRGRLVGDFLIEHPTVHLDLGKARHEKNDRRPVKERGRDWQRAAEAIYPLQVDVLTLTDGDVTYVPGGAYEPLHVSKLNVAATNIRNVRSPDRTYPSQLHVDAFVFDQAPLVVDGWADFLAEPTAAFAAGFSLHNMPLGYLRPIARSYNLDLRRGTLGTVGQVEYSPTWQSAEIESLVLRNVAADYVHEARTAGAEEERLRATKNAAAQATNKSHILLRVDKASLVRSELAYVDRTTDPPYRLFFDSRRTTIRNLASQRSQGNMTARVTGEFMGSGPAQANATFRPEIRGPDFDLAVRIARTDLPSLNDLLRAYGGFEVAKGLFSLYAQVRVANNAADGYVKPIFRDVQVYSAEQQASSGIGHKAYEAVIGGVAKLLENRSRKQIATRTDISGPFPNPKTSTLQALVGLVSNAFFKAVLPGLERRPPPT